MSCGPACLRMLAEWATGQPQSESRWRQLSGWSDGLEIEKMTPALAYLPGLLSSERLPAEQVQEWHQAALPELTDDSVYLLYTDCYGADGQNLWHWIVLLNLFDSVDKEPDGSSRHQLALCADPLCDELTVWTWRSLLASKVVDVFHVVRVAPSDRRHAPTK